eukprot:s3328_g2.t1
MGVINFDLNLTESEMEQNTWSSALQKWYSVFSSGRPAWPKGYDLDKAMDSHDVQSLREVFGSRSANTVLRRGNTMVRFMKWYRDSRFSLCPFPISEVDVEDYLGHLTKIKAGASSFSGFLEAIRFCEHVVGIAGAATCISIKAQKMSELADLERPEKHQARVLSVNEVEALERILIDEKVAIADRYAAGALLFCLYSRSRLSDLKKVRGYVKDVIEVNGAISGYIEFRTRSHKTARLVSRQGIAMPLVAPVWGLSSPPWGLNFIRVAELAGIQLSALHDDALLPAPVGSLDAGWQPRSVTTNEAGKWLRSLLSGQLGEIEYTTVHCLKGTPLSWCAKAGLSETTRLLLGHHVSGKHSADVYARDALAAPLREFDGVLQNIRGGNFMPDATRSGMIGEATRQDPKDSFTVSIEEEKPADSSSSSSDSDSSSDESHRDLLLPADPVGEKAQWEPDYEMYQHDKSQIVHLRAEGSQQNSFSCGVRMTAGFKRVKEVDFLMFRKCKRCVIAKPCKDLGLAGKGEKHQIYVKVTRGQVAVTLQHTGQFWCAMGTLLESKEALRARGLEVHLTEAEIDAVIASGVSSLARLAFAASPPGTTPSDEQVRGLFTGGLVPNMGTLASLKRLIFEAQTLVVADVKAKVTRKEENIPTNMAPAERENRIAEQRKRLTGLRLRGEEEVGHNVYDLLLAMAEKDVLIYHGPEKFHTRRQELLNRKPGKELAIDASSLVVKEKPADLVCATNTELEVVNALRRRALAFDLTQLCPYDIMNGYHAELIDHLSQPAPPGYSAVSLHQILRADRQAFMLMSERLTTLKKDSAGKTAIEKEIMNVLSHSSVSFHLLPLAKGGNIKTPAQPAQPKTTAAETPRKRSRSPSRQKPRPGKGKGGGKGKTGKGGNRRGRGPNVPELLIGKALQTKDQKRICWAFNLPNGCAKASPGGSCDRGLHVCAEPGCQKPHSMQSHSGS